MLAALVLGYPIWIALLLYPAVGILGVLAVGVILALRTGRADRSAPGELRPAARPEWG